ncbi:hypothetical protein BH09PAT1_BH09PAT1_6920 [soil metagenome]
MGKIRTRFIGDEGTEDEQKKDQKERAKRKKMEKILHENPEVSDELVEKKEKDAKEAESKPKSVAAVAAEAKKSTRKAHKRGKKYNEAKKKLDLEKDYEVKEAIEALKKVAFAKFAESVELHLNTNKEALKGEIELPHSTGKTVRVAIVNDEVIGKLEQGIIDFDILITHPSFMPRIAKYARTLGPKGLMPNPKSGTVSPNPEEVAKKFEKGTLRWKTEGKAPLIHQMVAKLPSSTDEIAENVVAFIETVGKKNIKAAFIKSTMSPALKLNLESIA